MAALFDKLRAALKSPSPNATDLRRALNEANTLRDEALKDKAWLAGQRGEMLVATDSQRSKHKSDLADADNRAADAEAYACELSKRLATAERAEDEKARREAYDAATAAAATAVRTVQKNYASHAAKLLGTLRTIAEAQLAVDRANEALPAGAAPIADIELTARGRQAQPRRVLKESTVELWCRVGATEPLGLELQDRVTPSGRRDGFISPMASAYGSAGNVDVIKQFFRRTEFLPPTDWHIPPRIASELNLPGIFKAPIASPFGSNAVAILAAIDEALAPKPPVAEPMPQVEHVLIAEPPKLMPHRQIVDTSRSALASQPRQQSRGRR